jgi:hypothetical protein
MGLDNLLAKMEQRATATLETPCNLSEVSAKPTPLKACTLATPATPEIINAVVNVGNDLPEAANDPAPDTRHFRWLIHFPDCDPVEHTFLPELTHVEVMAWHPTAIAAEPLPERTRQTATPEQETELLALVASAGAAYSFTHAEQQEALNLALWDIDAALQSYRALAVEQGIILDRDDRRFCTQCANLIGGKKCMAWQAVGARSGYEPVRDIPRRCEGYAPGSTHD